MWSEHEGLYRQNRPVGAWEREAHRVIVLAGAARVELDGEALVLGDVRDLMALHTWLLARQCGGGAAGRHPAFSRARLFLA